MHIVLHAQQYLHTKKIIFGEIKLSWRKQEGQGAER